MEMMEEMKMMEEGAPMEEAMEGGEGEMMEEPKMEEEGAKADMMADAKILDPASFEECTAKTDLPKLLV